MRTAQAKEHTPGSGCIPGVAGKAKERWIVLPVGSTDPARVFGLCSLDLADALLKNIPR